MKKNIVIIAFVVLANLLALNSIAQVVVLEKESNNMRIWKILNSFNKVEGYMIDSFANIDSIKILPILQHLPPEQSKPELLADETTITAMKNDCKIESDNEKVAVKLIQTFEQIIKRYSVSTKKDRHGAYRHYTLYVNKEDSELIKKWAKTNL